MAEKLNPQQWFDRVQGTQEAILRVLGELIATHPNPDRVIGSIQIAASVPDIETDHELQGRLGMEAGIQSVLAYAQVALARAATLKADRSNPQ